MRDLLLASDRFWNMSEDERNRKHLGCGPGKFGDRIVPDTIWGLSILLPCQIHDDDYEHGKTEEDKREADCRFLHNIYILIQNEPNNFYYMLRWNRAQNYYEMVMVGGHTAFWKGKKHGRERICRNQDRTVS